MVSPELLRRYPFFSALSDAQLRQVSMISEDVSISKGSTIFEECDVAESLYLLIKGSIDLFYRAEEEFHPKIRKEFFVGEINPGEVFGVSAVIEPYALNATAKSARDSQLIKIDAIALRELQAADQDLAYKLLIQITKTLMERLAAMRVQLAATQS
jgi:CRP-like cAMP-binding protein